MYLKDLDKRNKFWFLFFLICASIVLFGGIIFKEPFIITIAVIYYAECFTVLNDQLKSNIIKDYEEMLDASIEVHKENLKQISNLLKQGNSKAIEELIELIDTRLKEEDSEDESN